jgi:hypothetical protein
MAAAGVQSVEVQLYDVATELKGATASWGTERLQTAGDKLQVVDEITIRNTSSPPRTLLKERAFEIQLPGDAELVAGKMQVGTEDPIIGNPRPGGAKGRYYFSPPLLPGDTRFAVAYRLPYRGEAAIDPMPLSELQQLVIVVPENMKFEPKRPGAFQPMHGRPGARVYRTAARTAAKPASFRISGAGVLPESGRAQHRPDSAPLSVSPPAVGNVGARPNSSTHSHVDREVPWLSLGAVSIVVAAVVAGLLAHRRKSSAQSSS